MQGGLIPFYTKGKLKIAIKKQYNATNTIQ